jgi:hypothetical protein
MKSNNPFRLAGYAGLAVLFTSLLMIIFGRPDADVVEMPAGFSTPILAMEFAGDSGQVATLVESLNPADKQALLNSVWLDMLFLVVYNVFLFFILKTVSSIIRNPFYTKLAFLTIFVMLADLSENIQLVRALHSTNINIVVLQLSTWVKWLLLSYLFLMIGRFLMTTGRVYDRIVGLASFVPLPIGIVAIFSPGFMNEVFAGLFFLLFPMLIFYTWFSGISKTIEVD